MLKSSNASLSTTVEQRTRRSRVVDLWQRPAALYVLSILAGVVVWELVSRQLPGVIFASPSAVLHRLIADTASLVLPLALHPRFGIRF